MVVRDYPSESLLQIALIENIQRENLNPIEEAAAYDTLIKQTHLKQDELANRVGKSRSAIANSLRLLKLPDKMQDELATGTISPGHARAILAADDPADQDALFAEIIKNGLSVREAEKLAEQKNRQRAEMQDEASKQPKRPKQPKQQSPELREIEQRLLEALGTKVQVKGSLTSGRIEVSYYSSGDLERLIDLLIDH